MGERIDPFVKALLRIAVRQLWHDPAVRMGDVAAVFGVAPRTVTSVAQEMGLPRRHVVLHPPRARGNRARRIG